MNLLLLLLSAIFLVQLPMQLFIPIPFNDFLSTSVAQKTLSGTGVFPFVTASIFFSILSIVNNEKKKKYNYINIFLVSLVLCIVSNLIPVLLSKNFSLSFNNFLFFLYLFILFSAAMAINVWVAIFITKKNFVNGLSLLVYLSVLSFIYLQFSMNLLSTTTLFIIFFTLVIIFSENIYYNIRLVLPNVKSFKGTGVNFLPLKMNSSGIMPVIIIYSFDYILSNIASGNLLYVSIKNIFILLSLFFVTKFYSSVVINTEDIAKRLKSSNVMISSVRPGIYTEKFLKMILSKLDLLSFLYLSFVIFFPQIFLPSSSFSGLSIVILVSVCLELIGKFKQTSSYSKKYSL